MTRERIAFSTRRFLVGKAGPFPRLVFREDIMLQLDQFAHLRSKGEHGGFLIGKKRELKSAEEYEVFVERFVPIPQRDDATRLVINREHLQTVERALKEAGQGEEIVGWAHTHPGFGVFLSQFDKEQHARYFTQPWQVAYVMDNLAHERAVYRMIEGEWEQLAGYYVLREMAENEIAIGTMQVSRWPRLAVMVLLLIFLLGAGSYGINLLRPLILPKPETTLVDPSPKREQVTEPVVTVVPREPTEQVEPPQSSVEKNDNGEQPFKVEPLYQEYIVQRGDNLWKIADRVWGDPSLFSHIAKENGIVDPSTIAVGRVLRIPPKPELND